MSEGKADPNEKVLFPFKEDTGWWDYGVAGFVRFGQPEVELAPHWSMSQVAAEIEAERAKNLYVVRRWVTPGPWERITPDDHPGVPDWEWSQYLEWRDAQIAKAGDEARKRLEKEGS